MPFTAPHQGAHTPEATARRTARVTGLWYLGLAITGMLGFLVIRPQIIVDGDPVATLANLGEKESLARLGLVLEMGVVLTQAMTAVWFYKLFRGTNHVAAWALAVFGMVNAVAITMSNTFLATALGVAGQPDLAVGGDPAGTVALLHELSASSWGVGAMFFGLWLIPMGYVVATSARMPVWMGRILMVGGVGYLLNAFVGYGFPAAGSGLIEALAYPATVGEFWMIGYLLIVGIRPEGDAGETRSSMAKRATHRSPSV